MVVTVMVEESSTLRAVVNVEIDDICE